MNMKFYMLMTLCFGLAFNQTFAQTPDFVRPSHGGVETSSNPKAARTAHELSAVAGNGVSAMRYKALSSNSTPGYGGFWGVGYSCFFDGHWGLATGLEAALFQSGYRLASFDDSYPSRVEDENFEFRYSLNDYSDAHRTLYLNVPLMLRFRTGHFHAALGGKAGFPLSGTYSSRASKLHAAGYYSQSDLLIDDPLFAGFGNFADISGRGSFKTQTAFFLSAEAGMRWTLSDRLALYASAYIDYGLNNVAKSAGSNAHLIDYKGSDSYTSRSLVASSRSGKPAVDKINLFSTGIKLALAFGFKAGQTKTPQPDRNAADEGARLAEERRLLERERQLAEERRRLAEEALRAETERLAEAQRLAEERRRLAEEERRRAEEEERRRAEEAKRLADEQSRKKRNERNGGYANGYNVGAALLSNINKTDLDAMLAVLKNNPDKRILIEGHTCNLGTPEKNMVIGQNRANAAKAYLMERGIEAFRIDTVSKGETEPVVPNTTDANRRKNRRIELKIIE
jgi:outer membrane protein OmpA-like peptidoglycan-associated protein